jgi:2-desacetyl-2-hydroxyethyl bacteriochlorophyllide A dehydrogenase
VRAVVAHGPERFVVSEVDEPADALVVEVEAAGVCAADRMLWSGRHPWGELAWPFVPGHELLGRVVASDGRVPVGARVTAEVKLPCGRCSACARGQDHLCPFGVHLGSGIPGAFAERVGLPPAARVHVVPDDLPTASAVLAEPMACALHAVRRAGVRAGDRVAIAGLGGLGALAVHAARAEGAASVTAVVRSREKSTLARDLGYDDATHSPADGAYDVVVDVSGSVDAVLVLLRAVRPGGRVGIYGVYDRPLPLDLNAVAEFGELTLSGGHLAPRCFPEAIALLHAVDGHVVVTASFPLERLTDALQPADRPRLKEIAVP